MALRDVQDYFETALEPFDTGGGALGVDWGAYVSPGNPFTVGQFYNPVSEPGRFAPARPIVPLVLLPDPGPPETVESDREVVGASAVPDPEYLPTRTVFEDAPGGIYETNRAPTDWDAVYEQYVELNQPALPGADVAFHGSIDWGEAVGTILGGVLDPFGIGNVARTALAGPTTVTGVPSLGQQTSLQPAARTVMAGAGCPPLGPKYAKICLATNEITPLRRRRRRRLLTSSDIKDLAALKAIVGGAALQGAVVQAIRR